FGRRGNSAQSPSARRIAAAVYPGHGIRGPSPPCQATARYDIRLSVSQSVRLWKLSFEFPSPHVAAAHLQFGWLTCCLLVILGEVVQVARRLRTAMTTINRHVAAKYLYLEQQIYAHRGNHVG